MRFGILEAGAYGVSQSRKRAFIWAASPEETLPEWPEPMHVFAGPELKVTLSGNTQYAAVRNTASGAPFRAITVRDTIGDLPVVGNGASAVNMEVFFLTIYGERFFFPICFLLSRHILLSTFFLQYKNKPVSWYQKTVRGDMLVLNDHISKEMIELNLIRCQKIPKRPGADWRDLPDEKVLSLSVLYERKLVLISKKLLFLVHDEKVVRLSVLYERNSVLILSNMSFIIAKRNFEKANL